MVETPIIHRLNQTDQDSLDLIIKLLMASIANIINPALLNQLLGHQMMKVSKTIFTFSNGAGMS